MNMARLAAAALLVTTLAVGPACAQLVNEGGTVNNAVTTTLPNSVSGAKATMPAIGVFSPSAGRVWDPLLDTLPVSGAGGGGGTSAVKATAADPTYIEGSTTNLPSADLSGYARALVKGTVTANLGTIAGVSTSALQSTINSSIGATNTAIANLTGSKAPGTAAANSLLGGGVYTNGGITLLNGQQAALQMDSTGHLLVTGGGGGTQFAEDSVHVSGDLGTMALGVRKDTATALAGADGDYQPPILDATGQLWVHVGTSALPSGAATAALQGVQGTGATFNPPTGGSGEIGYLSGLYAVATDTTPATTNQTQVGGTAILTGNGATGAGSPRVTIANDNSAIPVKESAQSTGGGTPLFTSALSTTVTAIKGSAGSLYMLRCYNPNSVVAYVQVFNVVSGSVTLGTTAPTQAYGIGPTSAGGFALGGVPIAFSTALSYAATTTATGSTAPGNPLTCNVVYN